MHCLYIYIYMERERETTQVSLKKYNGGEKERKHINSLKQQGNVPDFRKCFHLQECMGEFSMYC